MKALHRRNINLLTVCVLLMCGALTSCFTGVESTKRVKMTRSERKATRPTAEEELISAVEGAPLSGWKQGRVFTASSDRVRLIFDPAEASLLSDSALREGSKVKFGGVELTPTAYGREEVVLLFDADGITLRYPTGRQPAEAMTEVISTQLPMLTDDATVTRVDSLLRGRTFYTRTQLWYDSAGNREQGRKFIPVRIEGVDVCTGNFPMRVLFRSLEKGAGAPLCSMYMSLSESGADSRSFPSLFTIENPRRRFSSTTDANWDRICSGLVSEGMTKDECRLSLGNPEETAGGQDRMKTIEIWRYSDGRVLRFEDGLLVSYRQ